MKSSWKGLSLFRSENLTKGGSMAGTLACTWLTLSECKDSHKKAITKRLFTISSLKLILRRCDEDIGFWFISQHDSSRKTAVLPLRNVKMRIGFISLPCGILYGAEKHRSCPLKTAFRWTEAQKTAVCPRKPAFHWTCVYEMFVDNWWTLKMIITLSNLVCKGFCRHNS